MIFPKLRYCGLFFAFLTQNALAQTVSVQPLVKGLHDAVAIDVTTAGEIFLVEAGRHRLLKLSSEGLRLDSLGVAGSGDYQFDGPTDVDATNGLKIYVADPHNNRIQLFDRRLQFLGGLTRSEQARLDFDPYRIGVSNSGETFAWLAQSNTVVRIGLLGKVDLEIGPLQRYGVASVDDLLLTSKYLFVADAHKGAIHRFGLQGEYQQFLMNFGNILALASHGDQVVVLKSDELVICDDRGLQETVIPLPVKAYVDMRIWGGEAYLLTRSALYSLRLP